MKKFRKLVSILSAVSIGASMLCVPVADAVESKGSLVILGDSISSGYGLEEGEYNYGEILGEYFDYDTENFAVPGLTTAGLIEKLADDNVKNAVSGADMIVISIGGNDFITTARDVIEDKYGEIVNISDIDEVFQLFKSDVIKALSTLGALYSVQFPSACDTAIANIEQISSTISELNPDATVVFQNIYDPFQLDDEKYEKYIVKDEQYASGYRGIKRAVYYNINALKTYEGSYPVSFNVRIRDAVGNAHVADICSAFTADEVRDDDLTQPYGYVSYFTDVFDAADRDFHPNQKGHLEIAAAILEELGVKESANRKMRAVYNKLSAEEKSAYPELRVNNLRLYAEASSVLKGDYNHDGIVNASDSSDVLAHYADESAGKKIDISKDIFVSSDVNGDDVINASDASKILYYYAELSAGRNPSWD